MWVIACVLHNLIDVDTTVTYVPWSEFFIFGIVAPFSQRKKKSRKSERD
jgi:hypothetical protein